MEAYWRMQCWQRQRCRCLQYKLQVREHSIVGWFSAFTCNCLVSFQVVRGRTSAVLVCRATAESAAAAV